MAETLVSVVVPCFNAEAYLGEALESVARQNLPGVETMVIDDGSTDGSAAIAETFGVTLIRQSHRGASAARNAGTLAAGGRFIQYLDADDMLADGKIARQIACLEKTGADVAYGAWQKWVLAGGDFKPGPVVDRVLAENPDIYIFTDFWCPPAAYLFRRDAALAAGPWDESLPVIQDARFALNCALKKARFARCEGLMAYYRVHSAESLSRHNPVGFVRDMLKNAEDVERVWAQDGVRDAALLEKRRHALVLVYGRAARGSFEKDRPTFEKAVRNLERLQPRYCPPEPPALALMSRCVGYRRAETLALHYRRFRRFFGFYRESSPR